MQASGQDERDPDSGDLLISDADRDQISAVLSEHMAEGRLTADELDERVGRLLESRTRAEAAAVMAGLPALAPPEQTGQTEQTEQTEQRHHFHLGHEQHDGTGVGLPSWLSADGLADSSSRPPSQPATGTPLAGAPPRSRAEERAADRKRLKRHGDEESIGHAFQARRRVLTAELEHASASHDRGEVQRIGDSLREAKETAAAARQAAASGDRAEVQRLLQRLRDSG